jgi:protein-L-isoaspartate(D-aspartate) O-methyltransferase
VHDGRRAAAAEREDKGAELVRVGLLRSERVCRAVLTVRREDFVPAADRDHAYQEVPVPLPGRHATISCPHSYPLFCEALGPRGGAAVSRGRTGVRVRRRPGARSRRSTQARRVTGDRPRHVRNVADRLDRAGYADVVRVLADGGQGWPAQAPYDRICVTAASPQVPPPLLDQLSVGERLIVTLERDSRQVLTLFEKAGSADRDCTWCCCA